jgi:hypothetical protein
LYNKGKDEISGLIAWKYAPAARKEGEMNRLRLISIGFLILVITLTTAVTTMAKGPGRYQAMEMSQGDKGEYTIFILDTLDGHMWLLQGEESTVTGKPLGNLKYQGQVRPGKTAGEVILEFGKTK